MSKMALYSRLPTDKLWKEEVREIKEVDKFNTKFRLVKTGRFRNESFSDVNSSQVNKQ